MLKDSEDKPISIGDFVWHKGCHPLVNYAMLTCPQTPFPLGTVTDMTCNAVVISGAIQGIPCYLADNVIVRSA